MILVLADDITGAAELAGIGWRYGLKAWLCIDEISETPPDIDLLVVSSDTRSMPRQQAVAKYAELVQQAVSLKPRWIYKKIDSVLRGYVLEELRTQMEIQHLFRAFILPANPSLGRTISDGQYFVEGKLIHTTAFALDPEFPARGPAISQLLQNNELQVLSPYADLPSSGWVVGQAETMQDIRYWANTIAFDSKWAIAGAGDFFEALLQLHYTPKPHAIAQGVLPFLSVWGTSFQPAQLRINALQIHSDLVSFLPADFNTSSWEQSDAWISHTSELLRKEGRAVVAFDSKTIVSGISPLELRNTMSTAVAALMNSNPIGELLLEGGSTATALLRRCGLRSMQPVYEWDRGVVRMQAKDMFISLKPGSYALPPPLLKILTD